MKISGLSGAVCLAAFLLPLPCSALAAPFTAGPRNEPVEILVTRGVRAVYEATEDRWENGLGSALFKLKNFLQLYQEQGAPPAQLDLHAVFHGDAGYWLLTDAAYNRYTEKKGGNPNKATIRDLIASGISIELCSQTMEHNGWKKEDVLPSVLIVHDAYSRLVDLQLRNYAYIRF